jgi:hypothetical protein
MMAAGIHQRFLVLVEPPRRLEPAAPAFDVDPRLVTEGCDELVVVDMVFFLLLRFAWIAMWMILQRPASSWQATVAISFRPGLC